MAPTHPYVDFEATALWRVLDAEVESLVANRDLVEHTHRAYIVGALCAALQRSGLVRSARTDDT